MKTTHYVCYAGYEMLILTYAYKYMPTESIQVAALKETFSSRCGGFTLKCLAECFQFMSFSDGMSFSLCFQKKNKWLLFNFTYLHILLTLHIKIYLKFNKMFQTSTESLWI